MYVTACLCLRGSVVGGFSISAFLIRLQVPPATAPIRAERHPQFFFWRKRRYLSSMNTLVLLPGMDGTGTLFDPLVNALAGAVQTKVVAYPPAGPNGYDALQKFAEAALPVDEPVIVLGESFSGPIAVSLAAKYPQQVRGVVLCCTFVQNPHPLLAPLKCLAALAPIKQLPMAITSAALLGRHATLELRGSLNAALAMVSSAALRDCLRSVLSVDVSEDLAK